MTHRIRHRELSGSPLEVALLAAAWFGTDPTAEDLADVEVPEGWTTSDAGRLNTLACRHVARLQRAGRVDLAASTAAGILLETEAW